MAGAFDALLADRESPDSPDAWARKTYAGAGRNLDADTLARLKAGDFTGGYSTYFDPRQVVRGTGVGADAEYMNDPSGAGRRYYYGPTDGSTWEVQSSDVWDEAGNYLGKSSGDGDALGLAKFGAMAVGGYYGTSALNGAMGGAAAGAGAGTAGATSAGVSAAEQIAFLSANGMTDAAIAASFPELAAAGGLTGVGGGAAAATGAANWLDSAKTGLQTVSDGAKTLGISGGDLLKTGAAVALAKDVKGTQADPNLSAAINGLKGTADDANARAQSNDEYWRTTFAPRYLRAMDDQIAMGRELNNFNMGLARKYDDRYWSTTAKQQDAFYDKVNSYDTDAARARFAGEAGANADMQNAAAMQALMRDLNRRGVNPNSGVYLSNQRQQAQQGALQKTMAMNMAREAARKEGLNMRAVAAGLGGNLTGASAGFAGQAAQSAGLGMNGIQGANNGFNSSVGNWNATTGLGINALGNSGNLGMGLTNMGARANELNAQGWNQMIGYGLGMFGSGKGG